MQPNTFMLRRRRLGNTTQLMSWLNWSPGPQEPRTLGTPGTQNHRTTGPQDPRNPEPQVPRIPGPQDPRTSIGGLRVIPKRESNQAGGGFLLLIFQAGPVWLLLHSFNIFEVSHLLP